jgi:flagellar hook-associated protein 3
MRISTESIYRRFLSGLQNSTGRMVRAQEQVATGRRVLRPSDDATAAARVLTLQRELADADRLRESSTFARTFVDAATGALEEGSTLLAEARSIVIQGMNGTLDDESRQALGQRIDLLRQQMLDIANRKSADRFLFSGTATGSAPWSSESTGGYQRASYLGNDDQQSLRIGNGAEIGINLPGSQIFGQIQAAAPSFSGLTGVAAGRTASEGVAWEELVFKQISLDLADLDSVGVVETAGTDSTLLQGAALTIDAAAGTVQLGNGDPVSIPAVTDPAAQAVKLTNEHGAELTLDFTAWSGADWSGSIYGDGAVSISGGPFQDIDFNDNNMRVESPSGDAVLHLDMREVRRTGDEVAQFDGRVNLFDLLAGIAHDLDNGSGLASAEVTDRLTQRLGELDRHSDNLLVGLGVLGSRSGRLENTAQRYDLVSLQVEGLISESRDADITEAILDLRQAESTLQLSQATGTRLIQRTLLDFIR